MLTYEREIEPPLGSKPRGSELVDWKSTLIPVIPAEAGIQAVFELELKANLDAGVRRHDEHEGGI
jgi:hypothetical protein